MNPGYQQPPQGMPTYGQQPAGVKKSPPFMLIAGGLLGGFVLCNWLVGAFKIDGDFGRFLGHTGFAMGTAGIGILMLLAFHRITEKDKEHPASWAVGIIVCVLVLAIVGLGSVLQLR